MLHSETAALQRIQSNQQLHEQPVAGRDFFQIRRCMLDCQPALQLTIDLYRQRFEAGRVDFWSDDEQRIDELQVNMPMGRQAFMLLYRIARCCQHRRPLNLYVAEVRP
ncbi:hypothetical protein HA052_14985 [Chromobacterium haemolyticum]|uniref:Uncharacterized protein n=1 Tax=Chromobacterium fluminis TaxID=3044269 RepID=A0ABX0LGS1_9NEIS|nr:hypothetical protein [Chromobacterium haemolyticum]NHR06497.1 hypothetical protein [Chromobacterium haemolyticum]